MINLLARLWARATDVSHLPQEKRPLAAELLKLFIIGLLITIVFLITLQFFVEAQSIQGLSLLAGWANLLFLSATIALLWRGHLTLCILPTSFWLTVLLLLDMQRLGGLTAFSGMAILPALLFTITHAWRAIIATNVVITSCLIAGHLYLQSEHASRYPYGPSEAVTTFIVMMVSVTFTTVLVARITGRSINALSDRTRALERVRVEERARRTEVEHTEELARLASLTKGRFLANMSHELRTPLSAILGYAELLQEDFEALDQIDALYGQDVQRIEHSARHLLHLINAILDLSRIEAERMPLQTDSIASEELLRLLRAALDEAMNDHGVTCSLDASLERTRLELDAARVSQLLTHAALERGARGHLSLARGELGSLRVTFTLGTGEYGERAESIRELHALLRAALTELLDATFTFNERGWALAMPLETQEQIRPER